MPPFGAVGSFLDHDFNVNLAQGTDAVWAAAKRARWAHFVYPPGSSSECMMMIYQMFAFVNFGWA